MPEYLAPGVYTEEVSFRSKSIEGVSTSTAGFIGPARYGPLTLEPELLTSLGEFERIYGSGQRLNFGGALVNNYLWHAARAFFEEGGRRLYVQRVFRRRQVAVGDQGAIIGKGTPFYADDGVTVTGYYDEGVGYAALPDLITRDAALTADDRVEVEARFPGVLGNMRVRFTLSLGQNMASRNETSGATTANALQENDVVWVNDPGSPISTYMGSPLAGPAAAMPGSAAGKFYLARLEPDPVTSVEEWVFYDRAGIEAANGKPAFALRDLNTATGDQVRRVTLTVTVPPSNAFDLAQVWSDIPLDPAHRAVGAGATDSLSDVFAEHPANRDLEYRLPIIIRLGKNPRRSGLHLLELLRVASLQVRGSTNPTDAGVLGDLLNLRSTDLDRSFEILLAGGNDGDRPGAEDYEGQDDQTLNYKTGFKSFEDIDDISIVAAPGSTYGYETTAYNANARTIQSALIRHAEKMRYRIAVLDSGDGQSMSQVRALRAKINSKHAALYYPWVRILDPITRRDIFLPPSGFVAGIYARNDVNRAVYKAPANEVVNLALGFEILLNKSQQDVLNPEGINCFRYFEGRGYRLWGARTISSDPEWKYVNLRRYFAYLEHSIDKHTQWAVFEPNGEALWANVRRTIEDFLLNEWQSGALLGDKPEKAYFVRCDRSTMTQNDLDNGRLVCLIGVAPLRPAEFVIFRIGQWTSDAKR